MPQKPRNLDPLAEKVLDGLAGRPEAGEIVLGGYFALQHYAHHRATHDVDAWWRAGPSATTEGAIRAVMRKVATAVGHDLCERRFGDTMSFELRSGGKKRFSFQIAVRSVELEQPVPSAWPPILLETLRDNVGGKMNALIERGAPRDFVDIKTVVTSQLMSVADCWEVWKQKNPASVGREARKRLLYHLEAIEMRRPLDTIDDPGERAAAQQTREWFRREFLPERS